MYVIQKFMPSKKATSENINQTKSGQFSDKPSAPSCLSIRGWLLFWASLRLTVSIPWTWLIVRAAYKSFDYYWYQRQATYITEAPSVLLFAVVAVASQLVELIMIVLFIVAGIMKSARLYRIYYRYCILTLIVYIIAMILCFTLNYEERHFFGEIYLTYHIKDLVVNESGLLIGFAAIMNICLEVLLINLVKKMMNKYSRVDNKATCERI